MSLHDYLPLYLKELLDNHWQGYRGIAKDTGLSPRTVIAAITGERMPRFDTACIILRAMGKNLEDFENWAENQDPIRILKV